MVAQTLRISPGSGLNVDTAMPCARPVRPAWSEPSPQARHFTSSLYTREAPSGAPHTIGSEKGLERRNVRRLQALVALHDFERHLLTFGQRLVAVTGDRGEVDEHVRLAVPALDEAVALFI